MEILGVKFAPLNVPLNRRLETLSAALWILIFTFGYLAGYVLAAYFLFFTQTMRNFVLLYFVWMYYDWNKFDIGIIRQIFHRFLRNCAWHRYFCNYFPIKLVKTTDLDPNKLYLFCNFPHGIIPSGVYGAFGTDIIGCRELFPGLEFRVVILDQLFKSPLFRDYFRAICALGSSAECIKQQLSTRPSPPYTGKATVLIPGGAAEAFECKPGTYRILIKRRKGFVKLALQYGNPLVPVCSFGETDIYDQLTWPDGSYMKRLQEFIHKKTGIAPVLLVGRGFFQYTFGLIPRRKPVTVVVGSPMELPKIEEPTREQVEEYHEKFVKHLVNFFENEKHKYIENADSVHLEFV
ncbi:diacylglycerol O-acyltransferase 2-like isoform X2 [Bombus pyrosoma]|nr:diacylglycerol O-acyltransferase 2-like isoform X2 [Bombus pyrosoma]XP_043579949.1 diacylglycerol O-acyltransferase 2-like isoform X2 [Bombus pyrosoma]XP_043579950.1 diacylglycerol O-acyltransferase 2-like isoform X2 [Bombus pyrosoma]XP_043579951.1 diacylglycerol O-acyltransferase 2-like isoform X2 [Bombus pyrosoma]